MMLAGLLGLVLSVLLALLIGRPTEPIDGLGWMLTSAVYAGAPAALYLAAALGYGRLLGGILLRAQTGPARNPVEAAMGLGLMLTVSHGLGALGLLTPMAAIGVCAIGVAVLVRGLLGKLRQTNNPNRASGLWALALPAVAVMLVAASCAPGRLWDSEYGGYDALSYHLPIVQEWIGLGRIEPLEHNVYSFLPGYVESAFFHVAVLTAPPGPTTDGSGWGLLAGDGWRVLSAQWLHAGMALLAAWIVAGLTQALAHRTGLDERRQRLAGAIAGAAVLATPWVVVVASLGYNEMAVVALGAGALAAALLGEVRPVVRGAIVGALVGIACGAKPTSMFMIGPPAGLLLLAFAPRRAWPLLCAAGAIAGAIMLAPWMVRNALHGGNPVFPYASGLFGSAHWSAEQVTRFAAAHQFDGSIADRLLTAIWVNPAADADARTIERFRGLTNPQWGGLFVATALAIVWGITRRTGRRMALLLAAALGLQLAAWLTLTHIQSRFLLPCVVLAAPIIGLLGAGFARERIAKAAGATLVAVQAVATLWIWSGQAGGYPTAALIAGVPWFKGEPFIAGEHDQSPTAVTNELARGRLVYLLGGATPLYFTGPVLYHTTWDTSPLGELMRAKPGEPEAWAQALGARGVRMVLANYAELDRLEDSGWSDDAVTSRSVMAWLDAVGEPVAGWPRQGQVLYWLRDAAEGGR